MGEKAEGDRKQEPTLELPSLKLPKLRRRKRTPPAGQTPRAEPEQPTEPAPPAEPVALPEEPRDKASRRETTRPEPTEDRAERRGPTLPALPGPPAAAATGVLIGLLGTLLTAGAQVGCEAVTGVGTCGGGAGLLLLLATTIVMVLAGGALLKTWRVPEPSSTSFLAVGIVAVIALLVLAEVLRSPWMFLVIPLVAAAAYALAHWVTTRFVEDEGPGVGPDVR